MQVLLTRAPGRSAAFRQPLEARGHRVLPVAVQKTVSLVEGEDALVRAGSLFQYDGILLTSARAVKYGLAPWVEALREVVAGDEADVRLPKKHGEAGWLDLSARWEDALSSRLYCVGASTTRACRVLGLAPMGPPERQDAQGMLEMLRRQSLAGKRFLFPCSKRAREILPRGLEASGAEVERLVVYDMEPLPLPEMLVWHGKAGAIQVVALCSPSQLTAFQEGMGEGFGAFAAQTRWAAIGPTTAAAIRQAGLDVWLISTSPDMRAFGLEIAERWACDA